MPDVSNSNIMQEHNYLAFNLGTARMFVDSVMILEKMLPPRSSKFSLFIVHELNLLHGADGIC
jgi:hypothetical protein